MSNLLQLEKGILEGEITAKTILLDQEQDTSIKFKIINDLHIAQNKIAILDLKIYSVEHNLPIDENAILKLKNDQLELKIDGYEMMLAKAIADNVEHNLPTGENAVLKLEKAILKLKNDQLELKIDGYHLMLNKAIADNDKDEKDRFTSLIASTRAQLTGRQQPVNDEFARALKPIQTSLNIVLSEILCPWENIRSNSSSVGDTAAPSARDLRTFYGIGEHTCMVLGKLPARNSVANVQRAHLWPKHTAGKGLQILQLEPESMNSPRNYLLLQHEIEYHFDRMHIMFLPRHTPVPNTLSLRVVVLEQPLLTKDLVLESQNKSQSYSIPWSSLHNQNFDHQFTGDSKPFVRMIAQHAFCALKRAQRLGYVSDAFPTLGNETINLARQSLEDKQILELIETNKLSSLLVPIDSIEDEEKNYKNESEEL